MDANGEDAMTDARAVAQYVVSTFPGQDYLESEKAEMVAAIAHAIEAAVRADEDAKVERLFKWLTEGAPKYFSRADVRAALRGQP